MTNKTIHPFFSHFVSSFPLDVTVFFTLFYICKVWLGHMYVKNNESLCTTTEHHNFMSTKKRRKYWNMKPAKIIVYNFILEIIVKRLCIIPSTKQSNSVKCLSPGRAPLHTSTKTTAAVTFQVNLWTYTFTATLSCTCAVKLKPEVDRLKLSFCVEN